MSIPAPGSHTWPRYISKGLAELEAFAQVLRKHECGRRWCPRRDGRFLADD